MLNAYGNPELFKDILWFDGIKRINQLNDVDIYINSNSVNEECTKCKYKQLTFIKFKVIFFIYLFIMYY